MPVALEIDWAPIRRAIENGKEFKDVSRRFGVQESTIRKRAQRECWLGSNRRSAGDLAGKIMRDPALSQKTVQAVSNKASDAVAGLMADFVSKAFRKSEDIMEKAYASAMSAETARDLKDATIAFGISHQHGRLALGMDRPDGGIKSPWASMQQAAVQIGRAHV